MRFHRVNPTAYTILGLIWVFCGFPLVRAEAGTFQLKAVRTDKAPIIDGSVGDQEWQAAAKAGNFMQYEPRRGEPSAFKTEALVLYDSSHIYVALRAWDPEPATAQLTQRDAELLGDDAVYLLLDTYHDRQTAYYFMTNALGTQADGRITDDGRNTSATWDAPWTCASRPTDFGWTAEFAIPLTSIKYAAGDHQSWGINFIRSRRRSLEISCWAGPLDNQARVSQAGMMTDLILPPTAKRHEIIPYALTRAQQDASADSDVGLDVGYAITPQLSAHGTLHPDFATIEADQEQVNLTRFELSLPEKRQFFLEGQELFSQRIQTFYSRRISDISFGGKLLGKQGPWTMAFVSAQSTPMEQEKKANYTVGRLQHDLFTRSVLSFMIANRYLDDVNQGSVGVDANLFFSKTTGMTAQAVKSHGPYKQGSWAYYVRPAYDSPTAHVHVRYTDLGDRFADNANVIGFISDDNRRELDSAVEKTIWLQGGLLQRLGYDSNYNIYWGQDGNCRSWQIDESIETEFRNRWSAEVKHTEEFKRFERDFRNRQTGFELGYNTRAYQSVRGEFEFGRNFDALYRLWSAGVSHKITPQLSAEYDLQRLIRDPDPEQASTWIHVIRASEFFTKDLYLRVFFQTNSAIDRKNLQAIFVYRYRPPFGTIQIAYQRGTAAFGQHSEQGNTLFVKVTTVY
jgi:hypothetical protein